MRRFLALLVRELAAHRLVLLAAALAGLVPLAVPFLPWVRGHVAADVRLAVAATGAAVACGIYLLVLGATLVASDLAERRLSFFFARPVGAWELWTAKLAAGTLLVVAVGLLVMAPAVLVDAGRRDLGGVAAAVREASTMPWTAASELALPPPWWNLDVTPPPGPVLAAALALLLVGVLAAVHAAAVALRARTAWLLVDLAGLAVLGALVAAGHDQLLRHQAFAALVAAERFTVPWTVAALVVAGGVGLARGRTEPARVHRWTTLVLWPLLLAGALVFGAFARWTVTPDEPVFRQVRFAALAPGGERLVVGGLMQARDYGAAFAVDPRSGRALRLGPLGSVAGSLAFSADGSTAAWIRFGRVGDREHPLLVADLGGDEPRRRRPGIVVDSPVVPALSPEGSRVAFRDGDRIRVHDTANGRLLTAVQQPPGADLHLRFLSPDEVLILSGRLHKEADDSERWHVEGWVLDVAGQTVRRTPLDETGFVSFGPGGLVLTARREGGGVLLDPRTGEVVLELAEASFVPGRLRRLADGRWVLLRPRRARDAAELVVMAPSGEVERRVPLPGVGTGFLGGEVTPGRVVIGFDGSWPAARPRSALADAGYTPTSVGWTELFDATTDGREVLAIGLVPLPRHGDPEVGAPQLFAAADAIVWWDPRADATWSLRTQGVDEGLFLHAYPW